MKERPILFSGEMVRAILDGRKSQTRRVMKPEPTEYWSPHSWGEVHKMADGDFVMRKGAPVVAGWGPTDQDGGEAYQCKYGQPGDRLWVRETHRFQDGITSRDLIKEEIEYRADGDRPKEPTDAHWRPSIFMPRWASRIMLEIVSVRVERLQEIRGDDVRAEGCFLYGDELESGKYSDDPAYGYFKLWESINGPGSWYLNPWVWVISFSRISTQ